MVADGARQRVARKGLDLLRGLFREAIQVHSGTRCEFHNRSVGGVRGSYHLSGLAFDISPLESAGFGRFEMLSIYWAANLGVNGIGCYPKFIHLDWRELRAGYRPTTWIGT